MKAMTWVLVLVLAAQAHGADWKIRVDADAPSRCMLAAREVQRYAYVRTGILPPVETSKAPAAAPAVVLRVDAALPAESFSLKTEDGVLTICGGSDVAVLYGAYRFAELLGVRFDLHRDVIPDGRIPPAIPDVDETHAPLFKLRGINPFHDFPEGPDWWTEDDYKAYGGQLAKLRMNFIGFHCYPEGGVGPEPGVWIGPEEDVNADGTVKRSYPSRWANTAGMAKAWGYAPRRPSDFASGAGLLFPADDFGHPATDGHRPWPKSDEDANAVFNNVGRLFAGAFTHARQLGIKTCIGTEIPLTIPTPVKKRLQAAGLNPADPAVTRAIYRGMFQRIRAAHPLDYYWLWTPEGWTWGGNKPEEYAATLSDIRAALGALDDLGHPFELATCGWVLGPAHDRAALHTDLPKSVPLSAINRGVGHEPVDAAFASLTGRESWAIPWLENDPNMVGPQPWVGRMRADAVDARKYGCTGLLGIHWRTAVMSMNINALAQAAWDQSWARDGATRELGALGGSSAAFSAPVADTEQPVIYQTVRYDLKGYRLEIPNGMYAVTLKLNEPHYEEAGRRRFGARVQGRTAFEALDLFARFGRNRAHDVTVRDVRVDDGILGIEFVYDLEFPCVAGLVIEGTQDAANQFPARPYARRINCGGGAWRDFEADVAPAAAAGRDRGMPVADFYRDWATARFGPEAGVEAAAILAKVDGVAFPEISGWNEGPGGLGAAPVPWETEAARFGFVDEFAALRPRVNGAANLARFDYWLNTFRYARTARELSCARHRLDGRMGELQKENDAARKAGKAAEALAVRLEMARLWEQLMTHQAAAVETPGELGTLANLEQHSRETLRLLTAHDAALRQALGRDELPADAEPSREYTGAPRIIVPTVRTMAGRGEMLRIPILAPSARPWESMVLHVRAMDGRKWTTTPARHIGRAVYEANVAILTEPGIEYFVEGRTAEGDVCRWPLSAPKIGQTVVMAPF